MNPYSTKKSNVVLLNDSLSLSKTDNNCEGGLEMMRYNKYNPSSFRSNITGKVIFWLHCFNNFFAKEFIKKALQISKEVSGLELANPRIKHVFFYYILKVKTDLLFMHLNGLFCLVKGTKKQ